MKKTTYIIKWIIIGVVGLALQIAFAYWATKTEKDPDLEETRQFEPQQYAEVAAKITPEGLQAHITALSAIPSRLTGSPGAEQAAAYVSDQFRALGVGEPVAEEFPVTVPTHTTAEARTTAGVFPLHPIFPNGVCPSAFPAEGFKTRLVYAGYGRLSDVEGKELEGATVVVETGGREQWLYLIDLGARAVIFVENGQPVRSLEGFTQTGSSQNVPRFWMTAVEAAPLLTALKLGDVDATLYSDARWEQRTGKNIYIDIPGKSTAEHNQNEVVVFQAYYDSSSFVPDLAPGAEQACGIATLIELGKLFNEYRFQKTVRLLATSGHFQALEGIRQYVWNKVGKNDHPMRDVSPGEHAAFFSLDLSSSSHRVGLFYGGHFFQQLANNLKPRLSDLGRRATKYVTGDPNYFPEKETPAEKELTGIAKMLNLAADVAFADTINPIAGKEWYSYLPTAMALEHEAALLAGIPALSFVTTDDTRLYCGTPNDHTVNIEKLTAQVRLLSCLLPNAFNVEGRYLKRSLPRSICHIKGRVVSFDPRAGYLPDKAVPGAVVVARRLGDLSPSSPFYTNVRAYPTLTTNENGEFELVGFGTSDEIPAHMCTIAFEPYVIDRGKITWAPDFGRMGAESYPTFLLPVQKEMQLMCVNFACSTLEIYNIFDPRNYNYLVSTQVLEAGSNSVPPVYGSSLVQPAWPSYMQAPSLTVFAPAKTRLKIMAGAGEMNKRLLLLNVPARDGEDPALALAGMDTDATITTDMSQQDKYTLEKGKHEATGIGFNIDETPYIKRAYYQSVLDMWRLNEKRITDYASRGIENGRVTTLHDSAKEAIVKATEHLKNKRYRDFYTESRRALSLEARAYPDVLGMANDTVRGLLFYLALLLPFAFTMERLFLAGRRIETRILGIAAFFLGMFAILRFTHPGFLIVLSPMVVLLGFVIALLSATIISIVMSKLEALVSKRKTEQQGEHESGVQAVSGFTLALEMGIANMRRRKARTVLTSITLIVLTFAVLSFVSVSEQVKMQRYTYEEGATPYKGALIRTNNWAPFPFETYASLRNEFDGRATIAPRRWYYGALVLNQTAIDIQQGNTIRSLRALIGLTSQEDKFTSLKSALIGNSQWLSPEEAGKEPSEEVLIPLNLAVDFTLLNMPQETKVASVDPLIGRDITFYGKPFKIAGVFDTNTLRANTAAEQALVTHYMSQTEDLRPLKDILLAEFAVLPVDAEPLFRESLGAPFASVAGVDVPTAGMLFLDQALQEKGMAKALIGQSHLAGPGEILLPLSIAMPLAIGEDGLVNQIIGQKVALLGRQMTVTGVFDWGKMNSLVDIDGETLSPYDPVQMEKKAQEEGVPDPTEVQRYIHHSFKDVAILPERTLGNLGGDIRSLAILPNNEADVLPMVEELVQRMDYILFANLDNKPTLLSSRNATNISDYWNLIVLTLIAALIVFNTMLGSVYERTKEIGTYTALGIAPSHIGRLFLVEAGVFAIIGVMAGYVTGQTISRLVYLTDLPLLGSLNLNYSSLAGVGACIVVISVVLLSSMYPARKATEIGVPDIERRWKLPKTKEVKIRLELPFTVSPREAQGLVTYLKEYLDSHVDVSVGNFYVEEVEAGPDIGGGVATGVRGRFWLTPFDLGVSQYTTIILTRLEGMDVCGVHVDIERLSGDASSWRRANGHFMTDMRSQFLIWRNLTPAARADYVKRGQDFAII